MTTYYMGIDVSKGYADFIIMDSAKKPIDSSFQLDDTAAGHRRLFSYLADFFATHPGATLYAAVESTGGFENNWYNALLTATETLSLHVARLNPALIYFNSKAHAQRNKTDITSAKEIARYQIEQPEKVLYNQSHYPQLSRLWTMNRLYKKQKTQLVNQFEAHLYHSMPELIRFCRHGVPSWLLQVIVRYPSYQALHNAGVDTLSQLPYMSRARAQRLLDRVQEHVGTSDNVSAHVLKTMAQEILHKTMLIKEQKTYLEKNYHEAQHHIDLLCTFKGIGIYSAVGLLLNIGDIERFPSAKHLASYFGLHPALKQSGDGSWRSRMSKKGRSEARGILYMVAYGSIQHNPLIRALYQRLVAKGMSRAAALGVCMHKIARIIYGMLKNDTAFDETIDEKQRARAHNTNEKKITNKNRRLQDFDDNAPISRRQYKKRKKHIQDNQHLPMNELIGEIVPTDT